MARSGQVLRDGISRTMLPSYVGRVGRWRVLLKLKQLFSKERMDASAGDGSVGWRIQPLLKLWPDRLGLRENIL